MRFRTPLAIIVVVIVALFVMAPHEALAQCSLCKRALEASGKENLIEGFKWSIIFMIIPPTLMTAGIGMLVIKSGRNDTVKVFDSEPPDEVNQSTSN